MGAVANKILHISVPRASIADPRSGQLLGVESNQIRALRDRLFDNSRQKIDIRAIEGRPTRRPEFPRLYSRTSRGSRPPKTSAR